MRPWPTDNRYGVTTDGRVHRVVAIGRARARELTRHLGKRGYYCVQIGKTWFYVHRMVAETYLPNPEAKPYVAHNDGTRTNNDVRNLRWATPVENSGDMVGHGTRQRGENHPTRILTESEVRQIHALTVKKAPRARPYHREIAERFGVTRECVTRIANEDRWRHAIASR